MIKINLVPQEILDRERQKQRTTQIGILAGIGAVVLVVLSAQHYAKAVRLDKQLNESQKKFDKLQALVAKVNELEQTAQAVRARLNVIKDLLSGRSLYPRFMEDLVRTLPSGVWLTSLSTSNDGNGLKISMAARSVNNEAVAQWLRTLESSTQFKEPVLGPITVDGSTGSGSFSMDTKYTPAAR